MGVPGGVLQQMGIVVFSRDFYPIWKLHRSSASLAKDSIFMARGEDYGIHRVFKVFHNLVLGFVEAVRGALCCLWA